MTKNTPGKRPRLPVGAYVAARLHAAREAKGLTQQAVAARIGLTYQQLQKYEVGKNRISAERLHQLAQIYGQPIGWFFQDAPVAPAPADIVNEAPAVTGAPARAAS